MSAEAVLCFLGCDTYLGIDNQQSLAYAQRAHKLAPNDIAVIDTLAWSLINNGNNEDAVSYLEGIYNSTSIQSVHYHYAVGLFNTRNYLKARQVLEQMLSSNKEFKEDLYN